MNDNSILIADAAGRGIDLRPLAGLFCLGVFLFVAAFVIGVWLMQQLFVECKKRANKSKNPEREVFDDEKPAHKYNELGQLPPYPRH